MNAAGACQPVGVGGGEDIQLGGGGDVRVGPPLLQRRGGRRGGGMQSGAALTGRLTLRWMGAWSTGGPLTSRSSSSRRRSERFSEEDDIVFRPLGERETTGTDGSGRAGRITW